MRYDDSNLTHDLTRFKSAKDAMALIGGLSKPGKMPWFGWSISARRCNVGGKLAQVKGSVCHGCYALKGRYVFPNVQTALNRRHAASEGPLFVPAFIFALRKLSEKTPSYRRYFRWFDSGDLQSTDMLWNISTIAYHTPGVKHWLPTKESTLVRDFVKDGNILPENLTIRISAAMVGQAPPVWWPNGSSVFKDTTPEGARRCPAPSQGNICGDCRSCWNDQVKHVSYHIH
jgi:hypothetical protein